MKVVVCAEVQWQYLRTRKQQILSRFPSDWPILFLQTYVRGEPIVCTPHDAYLCFMRTNMDFLVMDRFVLDKQEMQPLREDEDWRRLFELD